MRKGDLIAVRPDLLARSTSSESTQGKLMEVGDEDSKIVVLVKEKGALILRIIQLGNSIIPSMLDEFDNAYGLFRKLWMSLPECIDDTTTGLCYRLTLRPFAGKENADMASFEAIVNGKVTVLFSMEAPTMSEAKRELKGLLMDQGYL